MAMTSDKFAVLADIHGNCLALEAVLADMARLGISEAVNLGDHLSGPLEAGRTADLLMRQAFPSIRGNHDRWLVELTPEEMGSSDAAAFEKLEPAHVEWLRALPPTLTYRGDVFLCHGTPTSDTTYWLEQVTETAFVGLAPIERIEQEAAGIDASLILCGHTHIQRAVRLGDGKLIVNPGSVGCPGYDNDTPRYHVMQAGTPDACYAIMERHGETWSPTFRQVPYDNAAMAALAERNGRPEWASAIATGWVHY